MTPGEIGHVGAKNKVLSKRRRFIFISSLRAESRAVSLHLVYPCSLEPLTPSSFSFSLFSCTSVRRSPPQLIDPVLSGALPTALDSFSANTNLTVGSETPGGAFPPNEMGFCDTRGNAWEW